MLRVVLALLYRDTNRLTHAADLTLELAATRPETVELLTLAGERYLQAGYVERAFLTASRLRDAYVDDVNAARGAMLIFRRLGDYADARLVMARYLEPSMTSPLPPAQMLVEMGNAAAEDNRLAEARLALQLALTKDERFRPAYEGLGRLFMQQQQYVEAAHVYAQALARWHDDPQLTLALARATRQAGDYPQAVTWYQQAGKLLATAVPWLELGALYHEQQQEDHGTHLLAARRQSSRRTDTRATGAAGQL